MTDTISEYTTQQVANANHVKPQTVLKRYCQTGSYFGLVPRKLPNGRLSWPRCTRDRFSPASQAISSKSDSVGDAQ